MDVPRWLEAGAAPPRHVQQALVDADQSVFPRTVGSDALLGQRLHEVANQGSEVPQNAELPGLRDRSVHQVRTLKEKPRTEAHGECQLPYSSDQ